MAFFEGYANPETGELSFEMLPRETWERAIWDETEGRFRTTGQPLHDFCESPETRGQPNSFTLQTINGSVMLDEDCPKQGAFPYSSFGRAYCAQVRMTSNWTVPIENVYAEIVLISDDQFSMYTHQVLTTFGLGNGAEPPPNGGNNAPTDTNGGLVFYDDYSADEEAHEEWWIFRRPSDSDFLFSGIIVYEALELDNDLDDDCDGLVDEDTSTYENGDICYSDGDCIGGKCDCGVNPCTTGQTPTCRTPYCGDGIEEGAEECDPGAVGVNSATCNSDCTDTVCGDNKLNTAAGEVCDPGTVGGFTASCDSDCTPSACPDGLLNTAAGEICDDGNVSNTDACLTDCTEAYCGDGHTRTDLSAGNPDYEQCDDANSINTDGCIDCRQSVCGDGWVLLGSEACDGDGAGTPGETVDCDQNCTAAVCGDSTVNVTRGETCDTGGNTVTCDNDCTTPTCGDGLVNPNYTAPGATGPEQCDLGSGTNADAGSCTTTCRNARCGDGFRRTDITNPAAPGYEACDDGAANSDTAPGACRTTCQAASCGDGTIDPGEVCDDGNLNSDVEPGACRTDCTYFRCGDDVVDPPNPGTGAPAEACDDGLPDVDDGIANSNTTPDACRENCTLPRCGDGVRDSGEACDDGNTDNNDGCRVGCVISVCGDGVLWATDGGTETCDDGNTTSGDGCNSGCALEAGWSCSPGSPCIPICGDGLVRGDEQCDDNNTTSNDGCSSICRNENGWVCSGTPSSCNTVCGDGIRAGTEICDTGSDTASCDAFDCSAVACGDGHRNLAAGESCDDGNTSYNDACLGNCTTASCGDGWVRSGVESCDGNGSGVGGETATCDPDCTPRSCGDGYRNNSAGEQCDNGGGNSNTSPNACRTNCQLASCGDGTVDSGEQCDQGALNSNTAANRCRTNCRVPTCGDGVLDTAYGEQCDGTQGVSGAQRCTSSCQIDNDGDGYLAPADCNDSNANINPGANAAETAGGIFDTVDSNCDGYNFPANDSNIRIVQAASCTGSALGSRCYQQTPTTTSSTQGLQGAINASGTNGKVLILGAITLYSPVTLKNSVDIYGGWQGDWSRWDGSGAAYRADITYRTRAATPYHAVFVGAGLSSNTEIAYLNTRTESSSTSTDVNTLHGMVFSDSDGLNLHDNTIFADIGFAGSNTNHGNVFFGTENQTTSPYTDIDDCDYFDCSIRSYGGQGNGWRVYCPPGHTSNFWAGNAALHGGGAGGSSIGLMLSTSSGATITGNTIQASRGGNGGSYGGRGGQAGNSFSVYMFKETVSGWSVSAANGSPVDCASNQGGNSMSFSTGGTGGAGTEWARGRNGVGGRCHYQQEWYEWYYDCSTAATTTLRSATNRGGDNSSTTNVGIRLQFASSGQCN